MCDSTKIDIKTNIFKFWTKLKLKQNKSRFFLVIPILNILIFNILIFENARKNCNIIRIQCQKCLLFKTYFFVFADDVVLFSRCNGQKTLYIHTYRSFSKHHSSELRNNIENKNYMACPKKILKPRFLDIHFTYTKLNWFFCCQYLRIQQSTQKKINRNLAVFSSSCPHFLHDMTSSISK